MNWKQLVENAASAGTMPWERRRPGGSPCPHAGKVISVRAAAKARNGESAGTAGIAVSRRDGGAPPTASFRLKPL